MQPIENQPDGSPLLKRREETNKNSFQETNPLTCQVEGIFHLATASKCLFWLILLDIFSTLTKASIKLAFGNLRGKNLKLVS